MGYNVVGVLEYVEEDTAEESIDDYGLTTLSRTFSGPRSSLEDFLETIEDGDQDEEFPDLTLVRRRVVIHYDGPTAKVTLPFKGIRDTEIKPKRRKGLIRKVVVLTAPHGGTVTVTYDAPFATFKYATEKEPNKPRFLKTLLKVKGARIISIEGDPDADVRAGSVHVSVLGGGGGAGVGAGGAVAIPVPGAAGADYLYRSEIIQTVFNAEEEGGAWQVEESNEGELMDGRRRLPDAQSSSPLNF